MTINQVKNLTSIAIMELKSEKICLIEDIFKVRKLCNGLGIPGHHIVESDPARMFDRLYDLSMDELLVEYSYYSAQMSQRTRLMAGIDNE